MTWWLWENVSSGMAEEDVLEVLRDGDGSKVALKKLGESWLVVVGGMLLKVLGGDVGDLVDDVMMPVQNGEVRPVEGTAKRVWSTVSLGGAGCKDNVGVW